MISDLPPDFYPTFPAKHAYLLGCPAFMPPKFFPPPSESTPDGLIAVGGDLSPEYLLDAYRHGIFPWPVYEDEPMLWWSPDPRAVLPLDGLHISRRLQRTLRSGKFRVTCNQAFAEIGRASCRERV